MGRKYVNTIWTLTTTQDVESSLKSIINYSSFLITLGFRFVHRAYCLCIHQYYDIPKIPLCILLHFSLFFHLVDSFILLVSSRSFIFVRGEVHCVCLGWGENFTEICRQVVVVDVVVNGGSKLQLDSFFFSAYNTYGLWIRKLYNIYKLIIHKFYITYGLTIRNLIFF